MDNTRRADNTKKRVDRGFRRASGREQEVDVLQRKLGASRQAVAAGRRVAGNNRQLTEKYIKERKRARAYADVERDRTFER